MMNHNPDLNATKHFLADYDDIPDLSLLLETKIVKGLQQSQINPAPRQPVIDENNLPHDVLATTWRHLNQDGVLTREHFEERLNKGLDSLAEQIIKNGNFRPYPLRRRPAITEGHAYHDYSGATVAPIDVRIIITYGQIPIDDKSDIVYGLTFHLVTLVAKGSHNV